MVIGHNMKISRPIGLLVSARIFKYQCFSTSTPIQEILLKQTTFKFLSYMSSTNWTRRGGLLSIYQRMITLLADHPVMPRQPLKLRAFEKISAPHNKQTTPSAWYISRLLSYCSSLSVRGQQNPHLLHPQIPANLMKKEDLLSI